MIYANKKVQNTANTAAQTAKIIANVKELEEKNLISITGNEVALHPALWKDKHAALNWIKCLHLYCMLKKRFKENDAIYFKDIHTQELIGSFKSKKASLLIF